MEPVEQPPSPAGRPGSERANERTNGAPKGADSARWTRANLEAFARAVAALRAEVASKVGAEDVAHMRKLERWGRACTAVGYATAWMGPNPVSAYLISQGSTARWTIMMHHVAHRAFDNVAEAPERYSSKRFAEGARRLIDWPDWILPEAWRHEHNVLHHYHTGEAEDPDLVEVNATDIRNAKLPLPLKYAAVAFYACTWKLTYYAPSTFLAYVRVRERRAGHEPPAYVRTETYASAFNPLRPEGREFWARCVAPYALYRFVAIPALFLPLGPLAATSVLINSAAAEVLTNIHSFLVIAPNHAGDDLFRFEGRSGDKAEHYFRQVVGSANFGTGDDVGDFLQGYLNYQIEHHLWPDLPPLRYRELQPRVKALCEEHGIPYVQEGIFRRVARLVNIFVGKTSMARMPSRREDAAPAAEVSA